MKKLAGSLLLIALAACGGGGSPTTPATPAPTPIPVSYGGTYRGTMIDNYANTLTRYDTEITIVHTGGTSGTIQADFIIQTDAFGRVSRYPCGSANLANGTFRISSSYTSQGCGVVPFTLDGRYSGDGGLLNLTYIGDAGNCGRFDMRGELRR